MVALPPATPVTTPVAEPTVAMPVLLLLHVPPAVVLARVVDEPRQVDGEPVIAANGATETTVVALQPFVLYVIVALPEATPVTTPVEVPTVAIVLLLLLHVPPAIAQLSDEVPPAHNVVVPVIEATALTVASVVTKQPVIVV